ncbi:uncharacterized protein LOC127594968 [Hippocampus zosterae]|uniref:uncharacterized protein LOC127594968 n=1 Tax=Hippocampus zosterae TaxID=109293 RepID=UPI00223CEC3B|nr:uncharacterized protein LOC127594968 [Hippocampus zosterae]
MKYIKKGHKFTFKESNDLEKRREIVQSYLEKIKERAHDPVLIRAEPYGDSTLRPINRIMVFESTLGCIRVLMSIRKELQLANQQSLFLFAGKDLLEIGSKVAYLKDRADEDGLVYISYADYDVFGDLSDQT